MSDEANEDKTENGESKDWSSRFLRLRLEFFIASCLLFLAFYYPNSSIKSPFALVVENNDVSNTLLKWALFALWCYLLIHFSYRFIVEYNSMRHQMEETRRAIEESAEAISLVRQLDRSSEFDKEFSFLQSNRFFADLDNLAENFDATTSKLNDEFVHWRETRLENLTETDPKVVRGLVERLDGHIFDTLRDQKIELEKVRTQIEATKSELNTNIGMLISKFDQARSRYESLIPQLNQRLDALNKALGNLTRSATAISVERMLLSFVLPLAAGLSLAMIALGSAVLRALGHL